ncbi:MAG: hypothetical protein JRJ85_14570 [Deltaproteobacteria bacterium]|nr:hypothetical protein [Deltaproteobacteria bacterium]
MQALAAMCSHVPNKGEQMVRYYGYYSNVSRGKRKQENQDERILSILEPTESSKEYSIDYSMSQLPCFPDLVSDEAGSESDNWLYGATRSILTSFLPDF